MSRLSAEDFTLERLSRPADKYTGIVAYNDSKLCNNLFAAELHRRWRPKGRCTSGTPATGDEGVQGAYRRREGFMRLVFAYHNPGDFLLCVMCDMFLQ